MPKPNGVPASTSSSEQQQYVSTKECRQQKEKVYAVQPTNTSEISPVQLQHTNTNSEVVAGSKPVTENVYETPTA